jgi:hypothetical protein
MQMWERLPAAKPDYTGLLLFFFVTYDGENTFLRK